MKELEKKMQNENFDVEVQYCDPDNCKYDRTLETEEYYYFIFA